ncbi:YA32 [Hepatospora eriocheir]|uniref:YA32 n=1 Tax=Hepatospora eriocheir TaxID=1081669 RepID=A0A1X0QAX6_9MICR|nr:YA32 [Hepatospora eriocheir]
MNRTILDVLISEFSMYDEDYYIEAIRLGVIRINKQKCSIDHILKGKELMTHTIHLHEPDQPKIEVIADEGSYIVVNKPSGIPCHPVGAYNHYSLTKTLFGNKKVGCVNRIDLPTSGVVIVALKNREKLHKRLKNSSKIYLAKVEGDFLDHIEVDKPILEGKGTTIGCVSETGKASKTVFKKVKYKDGYSIIECHLHSGRTHQIRIHLNYLGYPIVNDFIYGKEKSPMTYKTREYCDVNTDNYENKEAYEFMLNNCYGENNRTFLLKDKFICLHAWKYTFNEKVYEASLPEWAKKFE